MLKRTLIQYKLGELWFNPGYHPNNISQFFHLSKLIRNFSTCHRLPYSSSSSSINSLESIPPSRRTKGQNTPKSSSTRSPKQLTITWSIAEADLKRRCVQLQSFLLAPYRRSVRVSINHQPGRRRFSAPQSISPHAQRSLLDTISKAALQIPGAYPLHPTRVWPSYTTNPGGRAAFEHMNISPSTGVAISALPQSVVLESASLAFERSQTS